MYRHILLLYIPLINARGVTLVFVLFFATLIAIIGVSISQFVTIQSNLITNELQDEKALYIAEAGMQHAIFKVRKNTTWLAGFDSQGLGDGAYAVSLGQPTLADELVINATGAAGKSERTLIARAAYRIETVGGTGNGGYNGDAIPAVSAQLNTPAGICTDAAGNIYIADTENHRIRMIHHTTQTIFTVAGNGTQGFNGGGLAINAWLDSPEDVFVGSSGNIFIADTNNHCIRKVDISTGNINTVAGQGMVSGYAGDMGPALGATMNYPSGVFVDAAGDIYIADTDNHCIRIVRQVNGKINTIAGTGIAGYNGDNIQATTAMLNRPKDIFVNETGAIYIADTGNHRIRLITVGASKIFTIAGSGLAGYNGEGIPPMLTQLNEPEGISMDAGGNIYIADRDNHCLRRVNISEAILHNFAGTGNTSGYSNDGGLPVMATMYKPVSVCQDLYGNLYIADKDNNCIRKISLIKVLWGAG